MPKHSIPFYHWLDDPPASSTRTKRRHLRGGSPCLTKNELIGYIQPQGYPPDSGRRLGVTGRCVAEPVVKRDTPFCYTIADLYSKSHSPTRSWKTIMDKQQIH